jgi:hypothetical protein
VDGNDVKDAARQTSENDVVQGAARVGYSVSGLMHLLIAWIGLQLAWGHPRRSGSGTADQAGALSTLAATGVGRAVLWGAVVGFFGLAIWQLATAAGGRHGASQRAKAAAKGLVYGFLTWTSFVFASGKSASSKQQSSDFTAALMSRPLGTVLVVVVGLVVVGVGVYHVVKGWQKRFLRDLVSNPGPTVVHLARFGYLAKGAALLAVGGLFGLAAVNNNPKESTGLDGALRTLLDVPAGRVIVTVISLGFAAYGLYSFVRARKTVV